MRPILFMEGEIRLSYMEIMGPKWPALAFMLLNVHGGGMTY